MEETDFVAGTPADEPDPTDPVATQVQRRARLEDVALRAGVSKSVISRFLNGYANLSLRPETRQRIIDAVRESNYRPHAAARALKSEQSGLAALLIPDLTNPAYTRIVRGATRRGRHLDLALLVLEDAVAEETHEMLTALLSAGRIDGLIVASARNDHELLDLLSRHSLPLVFANRVVPGSHRNVALVTGNASTLAVDHLADLGHRRIAHIAGPAGLTSSEERVQAFDARCRARGIELSVTVSSHFSEAGGAGALAGLLNDTPDVTAVFTSSLRQAVGVLYQAWERGLTVPDDLSVIAYDDLPLADFTVPPLTTIRMPLEDVGTRSVNALVDQLRGNPPADVFIDAAPTVVQRRSVAAPASPPS